LEKDGKGRPISMSLEAKDILWLRARRIVVDPN